MTVKEEVHRGVLRGHPTETYLELNRLRLANADLAKLLDEQTNHALQCAAENTALHNLAIGESEVDVKLEGGGGGW